MPPFNPNNRFSGAPSLTQLSKLAGQPTDPELVGEAAIKLNIAGGGDSKLSGMGISKPGGGSVSMPVSGNTTPVNVPGGASPAPVVGLPTSGGSSGTLGLTPPGTSTQSVLTTAAGLATEDDFSPFPKTPAVIVMPEHYIFGDPGNENAPPPPAPPLVTSDGGGSGAGAPPPPPKSYTPPPLVSAGPVKKSSPWLWLGLAAAAVAAFT